MEALRAEYTEVWCAERNVPLARFADRAVSIGSAGLDRLGFLPADDVVERLRGFDSIMSWYGSGRAEFRELMAELRLPVEFLPALPSGGRHAVDFYNAQVVPIASRRPARFPSIACPAVRRTFAAIHPFASSAAKRAPFEVFEAAAGRLGAAMPVEWVCGPEESLAGAVRIDDLYELACWLRGARIFVGNDSGISHLAAAVGTPVLEFFRASDARVWSARGLVDAARVSAPPA
jgi:ADP-heptose:LPS heptosyltransferase